MPPKKSAVDMSSFHIDDVVLGRLKGYPKWPGRIVHADDSNDKVRKDMPGKGKSSHLVRFFPAGDFAWMSPKDLEPLTTKDIETFLAKPGSKGGQLRTGYQIALDPTDWFEEQADLAMAREVKNATEENDQLASGDEMDYEGEDGGSSKKASNKRKRQSDAGESKTKESAADAKKRKAAEAGEPSTKKRTSGSSKSKSKVKASHSDDGEAQASTSKKSKAVHNDPNESEGMRQVRDWRHKLQRVFLGPVLQIDDLPKCTEYFDAMENFEMTKAYLSASKLGKVVKRIALLSELPQNDEFGFRPRAAALASKWLQIAEGHDAQTSTTPAVSSSNGAPAPVDPVAAPAADVEMAEVVAPAPVAVVEAEVVAPVEVLVNETKAEEVSPVIEPVVQPVVEAVAPVEALVEVVEVPVVLESGVEASAVVAVAEVAIAGSEPAPVL